MHSLTYANNTIVMMQHVGTPLRSVVKSHVGTPRSCTKPASAHKVQQKPKLDRFITNRAAMDLSLASFRLQDKDDSTQIDNLSPSKVCVTRSVVQRLYCTMQRPGVPASTCGKPLARGWQSDPCLQKQGTRAARGAMCWRWPGLLLTPPPQGFGNRLAALYSHNQACKAKKVARTLPSAPERILDAPDLVDDFVCWLMVVITLFIATCDPQYINVLDWSSSNVVAVALGRGVYLCNANDGTCNQLTELQDEDDYVSR